MDDKSHVSLEQQLCLMCGTAFDTGNILLDRRLRALEDENGKLKRLLAVAMLDKAALDDLLSKKW